MGPSSLLSPQEQHPVGLPRTAGPLQPSAPQSSGLGSAGPAGGFLGSQPPALVKQLLEQQKQQFLREQRQHLAGQVSPGWK